MKRWMLLLSILDLQTNKRLKILIWINIRCGLNVLSYHSFIFEINIQTLFV